MDLSTIIPIIFQLLDVIPKVQAEVKAGGSVIHLIQRIAPEVLPVLQQIGTELFPQIDPANTVQAGALVLTIDLVRSIQAKLNMLRITDDSGAMLIEDGSYGAKTKQAVAKFQKANGLVADGWAGALTQAALAKAAA